jgi:hypothetical protein
MNTEKINKLFNEKLEVVNVGLEQFAKPLRDNGINAVQIDWRPPAGGDIRLAEDIEKILAEKGELIAEANQKSARVLLKSKPMWTDIKIAKDVVPGMHSKMICHAGPPVTWERMCGPMRGGVIGALVYEKLAETFEQAEILAASGEIEYSPCHHHGAVGPMAGILSASMPVCVFENTEYGTTSFCTLNEGLGKVLRYGAYSDEVLERLNWMSDTLYPILLGALKKHGPIDMKSIIGQALHMGDEGHNRNRAGTSLIIRELAPSLVVLDADREDIAKVFRFLHENDHFFLNLSMGAAKCTVDAVPSNEYSSIITTMARNGTDFGIRLASLDNEWFTDQASIVDGLYLPGYSAEDAARDIGDSVITETVGTGGFAMAAAPAIAKFVGGSPSDAINTSLRMYEITAAESEAYQIPALDFRGTPTGIDLLKIIQTGILPAINTGIAHKDPGIGMVGAGLVKPPVKCFVDAAKAFVKKFK